MADKQNLANKADNQNLANKAYKQDDKTDKTNQNFRINRSLS